MIAPVHQNNTQYRQWPNLYTKSRRNIANGRTYTPKQHAVSPLAEPIHQNNTQYRQWLHLYTKTKHSIANSWIYTAKKTPTQTHKNSFANGYTYSPEQHIVSHIAVHKTTQSFTNGWTCTPKTTHSIVNGCISNAKQHIIANGCTYTAIQHRVSLMTASIHQ